MKLIKRYIRKLMHQNQSNVLYIIVKKQSKAVVGLYDTANAAGNVVTELGGVKYYRIIPFTLNTTNYHI